MRGDEFSSKQMDTLVIEICKEECPLSLVEEILQDSLKDCDNLRPIIRFILCQMSDRDLWKLYDRVLYHTRYKEHRARASKMKK